MVALFSFAAITAIGVFSYVWRGYVFSILWGWFVVTTFGLPVLGIAQSIGITLIIGFTTYQFIARDEQTSNQLLASSIVFPLVMLFVGWCVKYFM